MIALGFVKMCLQPSIREDSYDQSFSVMYKVQND